MSFGGAVSAMITSLKNNKRERKSTFDSLEKKLNYTNNQLYFDKKATPEQLLTIKEKLRKRNKEEMIKNTIIFLLSIILFLCLIGFVIF